MTIDRPAPENMIMLDQESKLARRAQVVRDLIAAGEVNVPTLLFMVEEAINRFDGCEEDDIAVRLAYVLTCLVSTAVGIGRVGDEIGEKEDGWTSREAMRRMREHGYTF